MAKKHAPDRKPYSPVDAALMRSLPTIFGSTGVAEPSQEEAVTVHEEAVGSAPLLAGPQEPPPAPGASLSATGPAPSIASDAQVRPKASSPERLTKYLKFQVSQTEQMDIVRIVHHFAGELGTSLTPRLNDGRYAQYPSVQSGKPETSNTLSAAPDSTLSAVPAHLRL